MPRSIPMIKSNPLEVIILGVVCCVRPYGRELSTAGTLVYANKAREIEITSVFSISPLEPISQEAVKYTGKPL